MVLASGGKGGGQDYLTAHTLTADGSLLSSGRRYNPFAPLLLSCVDVFFGKHHGTQMLHVEISLTAPFMDCDMAEPCLDQHQV